MSADGPRGGGSELTKGEAGAYGAGSYAPRAFAQASPEAQTGARAPSRPSVRSSPRTPSRGPGAIPVVPSPAPSPEAVAAAGILGGEFDDIVWSGRGSAEFAMDTTPPPGYVLVEFARTGKGFFGLDSIDWNGREACGLGDSDTSQRFERRAMWCDNLYPLRFRVSCDDHDEWTIVIRPVTTVRRLGEAATGRGSEVLLHTGPAGELVTRLRPAEATGSLRVRGYEPRRPDAPAPFPVALASESGRSPKGTRALPEGPCSWGSSKERATGHWKSAPGERTPGEALRVLAPLRQGVAPDASPGPARGAAQGGLRGQSVMYQSSLRYSRV
ncbi:hypothetical protein ACFY8C_35840 [Streptomyces flavochromogenes]|uniref:DUF1349 domain-containing protein n=1 Tax=Streptomyces flavochromogenes TaxID=68199 RepID=A0ABW6Y1K0_9ACTN